MTDPQHLLDLIREVRPRAALFTTYTFSVGHFDSVFVPVLRSVGCQDIAVLVDADEAARCSQESASRAAGRIYRIAPVIAPGGGVFHPKLAYLVTEAGDVLAVASGKGLRMKCVAPEGVPDRLPDALRIFMRATTGCGFA